MTYEIRSAVQPIRIEGRTLYGTAIPYNSDSHDLGGFTERFMPGSVSDTIKSGMIEACLYHDRSLPIGNQAAGTLRLIDSPSGLNYECDMPDTSYVRDFCAMNAGDRKDCRGTSFGFAPDGKSGQVWKRDGERNLREIHKARLDHISPVITPAYPSTTAALRSFGFDMSEADANEAYGIDLRKLSQIFIAVNKGLDTTNDERELAKMAINQLRSVFITPKLNDAMEQAKRILL